MFASLEIFLNISKKQNLIIVGDMNELGSKTNYYHLKLLKLLKQNKNNIYLLVGKILYKYKQMNLLSNTFFYRDTNVLINDLKNHLYYDNNIFIKGSNSINLQKVVNHLIKPIEN
jgi:UDP-N-acetylmuramyl pentapeptide synthase